jgi:quercetin dioxygenase-like cupin family protein
VPGWHLWTRCQTDRLWQNPRIEILRLDSSRAERISGQPYDTNLVSVGKLAEGEGEAHVYVQYIEPGGEIGPHEAGFGQLYLAVSGSGWLAGGDGMRFHLRKGHVAYIRRGEIHSKGSDTGLTALMIQVRDLTVAAS